jgi:hypothetical protein
MLTRISLTLDAADPDRLATFWRAAVGYEDEPPPAPFADRREWLRSFGEYLADDEPVRAAWLVDPRGVAPRLSILPVPEPKAAKNRLHMDLLVSSGVERDDKWAVIESEVERLVDIGATILRTEPGHHVVLADPEGNEFCVA